VLCPFYCYVASVALLLMRLSQAFKQGGVRTMFWRSDIPFLMILFLHLSFAQTCHMSYTIDNLSDGRYQSHPVTLACVDRDSYQSLLGLTYEATERF